MRPVFRQILLVTMMAFSLAACEGCAGLKDNVPSAVAQTPEQHAYAAYGEFVIAKEAAATIAEDPATPQSMKEGIATADTKATPVFDKLLDSARQVMVIRAQLANGASTEEKLSIAILGLDGWVKKATPLLNDLTKAMARKPS